MIPTLHIHLLGDFLLVAGDTPVTTVTIARVQSLLAYLAVWLAQRPDLIRSPKRVLAHLWEDS